MSVESVYVRYHLPGGGSRVARVMVNDRQLTGLHNNKSSFLWRILDQRIRGELGQGDRPPLVFTGDINLKPLREVIFTERVIEIDLTDVSELEVSPPVPYWRRLLATLFRLKHPPPSTNGT